MIEYYDKSYSELKDITKELKKFPTVKEWNKYAKENNFLCHLSLEYISKLDWNYLQIKVEREINLKKIKKNFFLEHQRLRCFFVGFCRI